MPIKSLLTVSALAVATVASSQVRITEWMYDGSSFTYAGASQGGEFFEITNVGPTAVSLAGWKYDDDSRDPSVGLDLSSFGTLARGESAIVAEASADAFRSFWSLSASVKMIGSNAINLGRADEINLFEASGALVDRLTYADNATPANGPRTQNASGNVALADAASDLATNAALSTVGDVYGSYRTGVANNGTTFYVGNPGKYAPVPEPASMLALGIGAVALTRRRAR